MSKKLEEQILSVRKMAMDNSIVTYDLTSGVDFSHPHKTAEALSKVFFENDASKWFTIKDGNLEFDPKYKAVILLSERDSKKVAEAMKDFKKDLEYEEVPKNYKKQIYKNGLSQIAVVFSMTTFMAGNAILGQEMQDDETIIEIVNKIMRNTEIRDVSKP